MFDRFKLVLASDMGNESSKSVAFISDIEPAESNSDADAGSQVLDHSTASIKVRLSRS